MNSAWRRQYYGTPCKSRLEQIKFGPMKLSVNFHAAPAFTLLGKILTRHNYVIKPATTGSYNCRPIKGSTAWSSHAWGLAIDVNWSDNPYGKDLVTDIPIEAINEILALETTTGHDIFRWGGDWDERPETPHNFYDAMHFEIVATPDQLASGIKEKSMANIKLVRVDGPDFDINRVYVCNGAELVVIPSGAHFDAMGFTKAMVKTIRQNDVLAKLPIRDP